MSVERTEGDAMIATDRYDALGMPRPDPATVCKGQCEGTGWVPVYMPEGDTRRGENLAVVDTESDPELIAAWREAEAEHVADDGWHFVRCPRCKGSGKRR